MYEVAETLPLESVRPGTNVLITGPPMSGKYDLVVSLLAGGFRRGDGTLVVSTNNSATEIRSDMAERVRDTGQAQLGIVDCVSQERGEQVEENALTKYVSSPADFTGTGMATSKLLEQFGNRHEHTRVALDSISQLLMYSDVKTVFRFLHVLTGRISSAEAIGFSTLDADSHDPQTVNTIRQLYDGVIETRVEDDARELRVRGLPDADADWRSF
jgi:KaiC/GvpD/RAD55 family RecA-like ATPase